MLLKKRGFGIFLFWYYWLIKVDIFILFGNKLLKYRKEGKCVFEGIKIINLFLLFEFIDWLVKYVNILNFYCILVFERNVF